jgi:hypothetical protein
MRGAMTMRSRREDALCRLASERRGRFLAGLLDGLTLGSRASYVEAGDSEARAIQALRCLDETVIAVVDQLRASLDGAAPAYPDEVFLAVLAETAQAGGCSGELGWAMEHALTATA